jgi:ATP-binding cassette subfamily F protein 3
VIERALREFRGTVLAVSHDRYFAEAVGFDTRWRLAGGVLSRTAQPTVQPTATWMR